MATIKNIIFDLGGVIYDIDYHKTIDAFTSLGIDQAEVLYSQAKQTDLFDAYEVGDINSEAFIQELKSKLNKDLSDVDIIKAWNALLIGLPKHRLNFLLEVKSQYNSYLLSNTNALHIEQINKELGDLKIEGLNPFFHEVFLSYELGMRKPHKETFEEVVNRLGLNPEETLFIDDSAQHLIGAEAAGLRTFHHTEGDIVTVFPTII